MSNTSKPSNGSDVLPADPQQPTDNSQLITLDRRTAIKWVMAAASAAHLPTFTNVAFADNATAAHGYGKDPKLVDPYHAGDVWPLTLSAPQRKTAQVLSDVIIPADDVSPAASKVGVVDFIDEWISAPYPNFAADRNIVLDGFAWLDQEAQRRFGKPFAELNHTQLTSICDELASTNPKAELKSPAAFFTRYRELTVGGFYTTPVGMKDIGYVGNVPLTHFDGPPKEVLKKLGLT